MIYIYFFYKKSKTLKEVYNDYILNNSWKKLPAFRANTFSEDLKLKYLKLKNAVNHSFVVSTFRKFQRLFTKKCKHSSFLNLSSTTNTGLLNPHSL